MIVNKTHKGLHTMRKFGGLILVTFACAFVLLMAVPTSSAWAYFIFGTVEVETGVSSLTVDAGQSTSVSVAVTPASDDQTLGCGMAKCPQSCASIDAVEAGYPTCFDANGSCTCAGTEYSTYYPDVHASSSNSAIATAVVSGDTIVITGNSPGEAVITVAASLRQWTSNTTAINVTVNASEDGSTYVSPTDTYVDVPEEAVLGSQEEDVERVIETTAGTVYVVKITSDVDTAHYLSLIAQEGGQVIFWSGATYENPDYSWTFNGDEVSADSAYLSFDPTITLSQVGTGDVANIMMQADNGLVLDFSYEGFLPGTASIYVRADGTYSDGAKPNLFKFNETSKQFELVEENLTVAGGYTSFYTNHCSSWALSLDNLAEYEVTETNTLGASTAAIGEGDSGLLIAIICGIVILVVIIVVVVLLVRHARRRARKAASSSTSAAHDRDTSADDSSASADDGETSADDGEGKDNDAHDGS